MQLNSQSKIGGNKLTHVFVYPVPGAGHLARMVAGPMVFACSIGRNGVTRLKREGDHATPAGRLRLRRFLYRPDRSGALMTAAIPFPRTPLHQRDAWCEEPRSGAYNRRVRLEPLKSPRSWDLLWREDRLYDIIGVFDWNICPRASYRGSAIFLHFRRPDGGPTAGCVALAPKDMRRLIPRIGRHTQIHLVPIPRKGKRRR